MCYYIGIEDLAANALIEVMRQRQQEQISVQDIIIPLTELENYGAEVVKCFNETNATKVLLILSRSATTSMFRNYSDFFVEVDTEEGTAIQLREGKTVEDLEERFRIYVAYDLVKAYTNRVAVSVLNVKCKGKD